jgi:iron complex outermembrane recepter protein
MSTKSSKPGAEFSRSKLFVSAAVVSCFGLLAPNAMAQEAATASEDEIIVTAQKREQSIQDVPISVTAVSGERLENQGIGDLETLSNYVPGVQIGRGSISTPVSIRGVGSGNNRGFEQSVGLYVDGVYLGRDRQFRAPFLDLERVEVLRGPQSILFGKNTIAGAISIISEGADPGGEFEAQGSVRWESETNSTRYSGAVGLPVSDTFALRFAAQIETGDGHVSNRTRGVDEPGVEEWTLRGAAAWEPTNALSVNLRYAISDSAVAGMNTVVTRFTPVTGVVTPPSAINNLVFANVPLVAPGFTTRGAYDAFRDDPLVAGWSRRDAQLDTESNLGVLDVSYDLGNGMNLTSVTGYSTYDTADGIDIDFLPVRLLFREEQQGFEQLSQELRLAAIDGEGFDFIGGAYYEHQDLSQDGVLLLNTRLGFLPNSVFAAGPTAAIYPLLPVGVMSRDSHFEQEAETTALFGEVTWNLSDALRVAVGGRYSEESKDFLKQVWFGADASPQGLYAPPTGILQENVLLLYWRALDPNNNLINTRASLSEDGFDPSFKIQWDMSDDIMVFATYSQGRKTGGFNGNDDQRLLNPVNPFTALTLAGLSTRNPLYDPTQPGAGFQFRPEQASSYEVGVKSRLFDGALTLNASAFSTEYQDLQVTLFNGTGFVVANAEGAEIQGFEAETRWSATSNLTLSGTLSYLDFAFSNYSNAGCTVQQISQVVAPCTQSLSGRENAFAPEWSGNFAFDWTQPIGAALELRVNADFNYRGEHFLDTDLDPASQQEAQTRINARIGLGANDGSWEFSAFGQNLTDEVTYTSIGDIPLSPGAFYGLIQEPRVFGVEVRASY